MNKIKKHYEEHLNRTYSEISKRAKYLISDMERLVDTIESQGVEASINTCGEIQSSGTNIDDLCKEVGIIKSLIANIGYMEE